ncbi:hypothetical protein [Bacillus taeanensis]|uniref:IDEAL domain-containing protein n=1 Tax=Bacillus taeanensis TaxID=273032 RepID=A0A366Y205_9BACI|nr:hypothetical protein [Bacillus taeanensis]RBW71019.1 hypothetical protein DS031_03230 [Bacillus taeanensis]
MSQRAYRYNHNFSKESFQRSLIALQHIEHQIECFSPYYNQTQLKTGIQKINKGDIIELTNQRKFLFDIGWYTLVIINNENQLYMSLDCLLEHLENDQLCTIFDFQLEVNYWQHQLDKSLEERDREKFFTASEKLNHYNNIADFNHSF